MIEVPEFKSEAIGVTIASEATKIGSKHMNTRVSNSKVADFKSEVKLCLDAMEAI